MAKILLADDDKHLGKVLSRALTQLGHQTLMALDGHAALDMAVTEQPDMVILDVALPYLTGEQVALKLRAEEALARTPILFISGRDRERLQPYLDSLQPCDFLAKPVDLDEVLATVSRFLGS